MFGVGRVAPLYPSLDLLPQTLFFPPVEEIVFLLLWQQKQEQQPVLPANFGHLALIIECKATPYMDCGISHIQRKKYLHPQRSYPNISKFCVILLFKVDQDCSITNLESHFSKTGSVRHQLRLTFRFFLLPSVRK